MTAWNHKGWSIEVEFHPIPCHRYDWCATSPDYDVDQGEDGPELVAGHIVYADTYEALLQEIEDCLAESEA